MKKLIAILTVLISGCAITNKYPDIDFLTLKKDFDSGRATLYQAREFRDRLDKLFYNEDEIVERTFREQYNLAVLDYPEARANVNYNYHRQANDYTVTDWAYIVAALQTYLVLDMKFHDKGCEKPIFGIEGKM